MGLPLCRHVTSVQPAGLSSHGILGIESPIIFTLPILNPPENFNKY